MEPLIGNDDQEDLLEKLQVLKADKLMIGIPDTGDENPITRTAKHLFQFAEEVSDILYLRDPCLVHFQEEEFHFLEEKMTNELLSWGCLLFHDKDVLILSFENENCVGEIVEELIRLEKECKKGHRPHA